MKKLIFYTLLAVLLMMGTRTAQAAYPTYTLLEPLPCVETSTIHCKGAEPITKFTINQFIEYVFKFSIALAVFLATVQVIIGGFQYMGEASYSSKSAAKEKFRNAAMGLGGALACFLILQTIDPRLVQINTEIAPICPKGLTDEKGTLCYKNTAEEFNRQVNDDLGQWSQEKIIEVAKLEQQKKELEEEKKGLKAQFDRREIDKDEYERGMEVKNGIIADLTTRQARLIAGGRGNAYFKQALNAVYNLEQTNFGVTEEYTSTPIQNELVNGKLRTDSPNTIQNEYNKQINAISATDPTTARLLGKQRDFYIAQVQEEVKLKKELRALKDAVDDANYTIAHVRESSSDYKSKEYNRIMKVRDDMVAKVTDELNTYKADVALPYEIEKTKNSGLPLEDYKKIMQIRADRISATLTSLNVGKK